MNPLYNQTNPIPDPNSIRSMLMQRFNIPQNINNPNDIIQHLLNTNQITQDQVNGAMRAMNSSPLQYWFGGNQNGR